MREIDNKITSKVEKELPEFADEVRSLQIPDLEKRLVELAKSEDKVDEAKENDEELLEYREKVRHLNAPYVDAKKVIRMKVKYVIDLIKEKGGK